MLGIVGCSRWQRHRLDAGFCTRIRYDRRHRRVELDRWRIKDLPALYATDAPRTGTHCQDDLDQACKFFTVGMSKIQCEDHLGGDGVYRPWRDLELSNRKAHIIVVLDCR